MKRLLLSIFLTLVLCLPVFSQQQAQLPHVPDQQIEALQYDFRGQWMPSADPAQIGAENYRVLTNLRYTPTGTLESVGGYTLGQTTVLAGAPEVDAGFHFKKDNPSESHVLVNADGVIYDNTTAIPTAGDFVATALHTDASGAGAPRFSQAPYGHVAYSNGVESQIWAGAEMSVSAFITSTTAGNGGATNPKDYSEAVNNNLTDNANVAIIGGGNDSQTVLLLHMDAGDTVTTFVDSSDSAHTITRVDGTIQDDAQTKFGISSGLFDGTGDYLQADDHANWYMAASYFTIDFWVRFNSVAGSQGLFQQWVDADNQVYLRLTGGNLVFGIVAATTPTVTVTRAWAPVVNTWYHVAVVRGWTGVSTCFALTINGIILGIFEVDADPWPDLAATFIVGADSTGAFNGWLDEFRVTKGGARWSSNFTPPSRPYSTSNRAFLVGSPRPLQGIKIYIKDANTQASILTGVEWNGSSWSSITIVDNTGDGLSLAQTGTVTWTPTGQTKVKFLHNRLLYWYEFAMGAGDATIYRVTMDAPWQNIVDVWDGVYRQPIQFQAYKSAKYEDYTLEVNESDSTYYGDLGGMTNAEHLIMMFDDRTTAIKWIMVAGKENVTAATVTIYYWDGSAWTSAGTISDTTLDAAGSTKSLGQSGVMSWKPPDDEQEFYQTLFGTTGYAYKFIWSATLTASNAQVNTVTGIPAQLKIRPFKFPAKYRDRLLLCGYTEGSQGNRCDYSMTHAPQVFNGAETSNGGINSLYFGGEEELTAGTQLYNRMGSNIFIFFIALKDSETYVLTGDGPDTFAIYPVSLNVGCPAPATLITAEMGFDLAADVQRHIAAWVSYTGPVIFDGAVIYKIPGLEIYFDPNSPDYLGQDVIKTAIGWFDQSYGEYNISVGTHWFVYNLRLKRWFEKHTGAAETPISAWPVRDTSGNEYVYGGLDNGFIVRLEYGTSWNGTGINQKVQTGDFWPSKNVWDLTRLRRVKLVAKRIAESHSLRIVHYGDGAEIAITDWSWDNSTSFEWTSSSSWVWDNGNYVTFVDLSGGTTNNRPRIISATQPTNLLNWLHGLRFEITSADSTKGFQPIGWALEYIKERKDY